MKILTLVDHYLPGTRGGGQLRTVQNLVLGLPPGHDFWIVTRNRDHASSEPYPGLPVLRWVDVGRARVLYLPPDAETVARIGAIAGEAGADLVYANSLFSRMTIRYLVARRLGLAARSPLLIAPRGECSPGALGIRAFRKRAFLRLGWAAGLYRGALWQASTERERDDVLRALPRLAPEEVLIAPDLSGEPPPADVVRHEKVSGRARLVFISRVARMKNLHFALRALATVRGEVTLDVFGPTDDPGYWRECEAEALRLPSNVSMRYRGELPPDRVVETFAAHDFSVLPTLGENFGHVIFESLAARCPVVLSDRTAWPDLGREGGGFTIPLEDPSRWTAALQACVDMGPETHEAMADRARVVALGFVERLGPVRRNVEMFERCLRRA